MSITIQKPGILDTVQDAGREGKGMHGIGPGGAMDRYAAAVANFLAGNTQAEALLEVHYPGPQIQFGRDALISITGADFRPCINDEPVPCWQPIAVRKHATLHFTDLVWGARAYIAFHGGLLIEPWLDSYSTHLKAGIGGWKGRKLEKADELFLAAGLLHPERVFGSHAYAHPLPWRSAYTHVYAPANSIRIIKGQEWGDLEEEVKTGFLETVFTIQSSSDRMGYQLQGGTTISMDKHEILSSAVSFGTVQRLPAGQLIVLMADHQTTGGYPRLGHVVSADLPKLAQLAPGASIRFEPVDMLTAEDLYFARHRELKILERACNEHLNHLLC